MFHERKVTHDDGCLSRPKHADELIAPSTPSPQPLVSLRIETLSTHDETAEGWEAIPVEELEEGRRSRDMRRFMSLEVCVEGFRVVPEVWRWNETDQAVRKPEPHLIHCNVKDVV
jgi:hypothetical protein